MKKKATSSSSNRASFESLQEAKDSVDQSFEELLKQLDEFYKAIDPFWSGVFFGPRHGQIISLRIDPNSIETKKTVLENSKERLHKLDQAILHSCSNICLFDAFNENGKFFLWLAEHQENWIRYLQAILDQFLDKQKKESDDLIYILPPGRILPSEIKERAEHVRKTIINGLPGFLAFQNSLPTNKPKRGRRPKADLKSRSNRELLIAILLEHHRYGSQKERLRTDPISTDEACKQLGKSGATLSKTWKEVQPSLTYAKYVKLCGHYKSLVTLLKAIDSKEGYLERSNRGESIDRSEG
jgi:hypothetical protein